jgi:hypothetical protein
MDYRFRWVVCQLDILKRLDFIADIREALSELPETLDETYERILCNIPPESQVLASKTLNLLSSGLLDDLGELLDALAVDLDRLSYSRDNRPLDQYAPIAVCTCLVTYNGGDGELEEGSVRFAHYTVKEYIMSPRVATGCASLFHVTDETVDFLVARCLIIYLLDANYDSYGSLMLKAITKWQEPAGLVKSEPSKRLIHTLILRLLNPTRSHFEKFIIELESYSDDFNLERPIAWRAEQGAEICTTLAYLCWYGFIEAAQTLLEQQTERIPFESPLTRLYCLFEWFPIDKDNPLINNVKFMSWVGGDKFDTQPAGQQTITIIHIAAMLRQTTFLELFISKGADLTVKSITGLGVLASALGPGLQDGHHYDVDYWREAEERQKFLSLLVPNDASPGLGAVSVTPLQVAIRQYFNSSACRAIIAKLLASGEDVNGVADDGANVTRIRHVCDWYFTEIAQPKLRSQRKSCIEAALHRRGQSGLYDTPLRILKTRIAGYRDMIGCDIDDPKYRALLDTCFLLESNGARSLHLFPVKELPGYCGEDMEEWHGSGMNETSSQPGSPNFPQPSSLGRDRFIPGRVEELVDSTPEEFNSIRLPVVESNNTNSDPVSLPSIHSFWNVVNN